MRAMESPMRAYRSVFTMRFLLMLQYRAAALAGFATQCWWGLIKIMVFAAFFHSTARHQPMNFAQAATYTWLAQAFLVLIPWSPDLEIAEMVRTGNVSYERLRPLDTYFYWYVRAMAWLIARVLPRAALMFLLAAIIVPALGLGEWRMRLPATAGATMLFAGAMVCVVLLSSAFVMLMNLAVVITLTERGVSSIAVPLAIILSGNIVPLVFFPNWMQRFLFLQPYAGLIDIPFRIYLGILHGGAAVEGLTVELIWIVILIAIGRRLMAHAMVNMQVQGG